MQDVKKLFKLPVPYRYYIVAAVVFNYTRKEPVCPRVELILQIIIILLIIFLGFIKSKPC